MSQSSDIRRADREDARAWGVADKDGVIRSAWGARNRAVWRAHPLWRDEPDGYCTRERAALQARVYDDMLDALRDGLTRSEQSHLYRRRKVWRLRAAGCDPRFEAMGGVFGGLTEKHRKARQDGGTTPGECLAHIRNLVLPEHERQPDMTLLSDEVRFGPKQPSSRVTALEKMRRSLGVK